MSEQDMQRREREMKATLDQIRSFNQSGLSRWYLDVPPWKVAIEGIFIFLIAFLVGLGFAVLYRTIFES